MSDTDSNLPEDYQDIPPEPDDYIDGRADSFDDDYDDELDNELDDDDFDDDEEGAGREPGLPRIRGMGQPGGRPPGAGQPPRPGGQPPRPGGGLPGSGGLGQQGGQKPPGTGQFGGQGGQPGRPGQPPRPGGGLPGSGGLGQLGGQKPPGTGQFGGQGGQPGGPGQPPRPGGGLPGSGGLGQQGGQKPPGTGQFGGQGGQPPRPGGGLPGSGGLGQPGGQKPPGTGQFGGQGGQPGGPGQQPRPGGGLPGSGGLGQPGGQKPPGTGQFGGPGGQPGGPGQQPRPGGGLPGSGGLGQQGGQPGGPGQQPRPGQPGGQPPRPGSGAPGGPLASTQAGALTPAAPTTGAPLARPGGGPASSPTKKPRSPTKAQPAARGGGLRQALPEVQGMSIRPRVQAQAGDSQTPPEPIWVRTIQAILPSFSDELVAILLIALGLVSLFTLFSPGSGALGTAWAAILKQVFGLGAFVVSALFLAAGAVILTPHLGVEVRINWWRMIFAELCFVLILGLIHLFIRFGLNPAVGNIEALTAATQGAGGGFIGWATQQIFTGLVGDWIAALLLLGLIAFTGGMALGVTREQMMGWLDRLRAALIGFAWQMEGRRPVPVVSSEQENGKADAGAPPVQLESEDGVVAQTLADGMTEVTMPGGRPSVVTGETGSGPLVVRRANIAFKRVSTVKLAVAHEGDQERPPREIKYRFSLKREAPEKRKSRKRPADLPPADALDTSDYALPEDDQINSDAQTIEETIEDFGMRVEVIGVQAGPTVTQYAVQPFSQADQNGAQVVQRVRVTRVTALAEDIALALAAPRVRIQAPVPGTNYIGVEVPNTRPGIVSLRPVIESERFYKIKSPLAIGLGREVGGKPFAADLASMPHLLIGGTTGSGKSVCLSSLTTCLVFNNRPDDLRLIMIDPKMVELVRFNGLPHLYGKVEVELDRIIGVLRWVVREMDTRYKLMEEAQARNISVYNQMKRKKDRLPFIVVLVDELAELMNEYPDETEHLITRLAQMARATGIHLVVATQRPSTDVVTGLIKANFPARIAFAVASGIDSRVVIDAVGAEDLIGRGDMLYYASDAAGPIRLQGCFVSDAEMDRVVEFWRHNWEFEEGEDAPWERSLTRAMVLDETDSMLEEAIRLVQKEGEASTSFLQRKLNVSYPRAGRIMDSLYKMGVVGDAVAGGRVRRVMIGPDIDPTTYIVTWRNNHP